MASDTMNPKDEAVAAETTSTESAMSTCPMAGMCVGMMRKRGFGWLVMLPGILLIAIGVLIVVEPVILTWLVAGMSIVFGTFLLMMAGFMRKMGDGLRR